MKTENTLNYLQELKREAFLQKVKTEEYLKGIRGLFFTFIFIFQASNFMESLRYYGVNSLDRFFTFFLLHYVEIKMLFMRFFL